MRGHGSGQGSRRYEFLEYARAGDIAAVQGGKVCSVVVWMAIMVEAVTVGPGG